MAKTIQELMSKSYNAPTKGKTIQELMGNAAATYTQTETTDTDYNKGGLLNGVGYTLGKIGTGAFSILEGIWDYTAGGIADIFGADEWAEKQFANNIAAGWNQDLDEWYNPSNTMRIVGDVASGVGNSAVGLLAVAGATALSGGALTAPVAGAIAGGVMGVGAAGGATSEAYAKTGKLGFKEYGYGALSGATEGALEGITGAAGKVGARLFAKQTAKTVAKNTVIKGLLSDFAGEAVEEGLSEFITPYYQRWTQVDPNAEKATIQQIGYSALVGGLAGALMGGVGTGINTVRAMSRGNEISKNKEYANTVVNMAEKFAKYEADNQTGKEAYQYVSRLVEDYKAKDNGTGVLTLPQKRILGEMERANAVLTFEPEIQASKDKIIANADSFAEYINSRNLVDNAGNPINFASGADLIKNEGVLTQFAVADALGQLMLTPETFYSVVSQNRTEDVLQSDFQNFQKNASSQSKKAINEMFGVDIDSVSYEDFIAAMQKTNRDKLDGVQGGMAARASSKRAFSRVNSTNESVGAFNKAVELKDGTSVYKTADGKLYAVSKSGNNYYVYDGTNISKKLTKEELFKVVDALNGVTETTQKNAQKQAVTQPTKNVSTEAENTQETVEETQKTTPTQTTETKVETKEESKAKTPTKEDDRATLAKDFVTHMRTLVKEKGGWYTKDVTNYIAEHNELDFIERIYANDPAVKKDLAGFLSAVDDVDTLEGMAWYLGGAFSDKGRTWSRTTGKSTYPYRGAVRTFKNAISKRIQEVSTGTNLGIQNGEVSLNDIKKLFDRLNKNPEIAKFAEKVFATVERLGVNIRFVNATLSTRSNVAGDNAGDMVEYKTSYFNDTTVSDQKKAGTLLHELIHACTSYVMYKYSDITANVASIDGKDANYVKIVNCVTRLNQIYEQISRDADFKDQYGITNAKEMVAELANEEFVGLMKKKNLWDRILDAICNLFGFTRGNTAYDNAMQCLEYILDNPDVYAYKDYATEQRGKLARSGRDTFGFTSAVSERMTETEMRDNLAKAFDISENLGYEETHKKDLLKNYDAKNSTVSYSDIFGKYDKILNIWKKLGGELNSKFLEEWDNKQGKDRTFTVFKEQAGYDYNIELSSMCKKGVPLFEAIDTIVKNEVMKELNLKTIGKAEKEILYDILKSHHFEIPCAICYVEQARQREGTIIESFLEGKKETTKTGTVKTFKLGWNEVINNVQAEMQKNGVNYTFPTVDRSIATDNYTAQDFTMDEATQTAFYVALQKLANEEIARYNKAEKKNKPLIKTVTPDAIKASLGGNVGSNFKIFRVLFQNPDSRFTIEKDLLYSSMTTLNLASSHNALYSLFNSQGGVAGYKSKQTPIVYWGDILKKTWESGKIRKAGGIRNQSNSDFQMYTLLDQAQMYIDFTAKGYYLQAYTKVLSELKLFGLSNGKINASLIPRVVVYKLDNGDVDIARTMATAGLDENGNPIYDDIEGIPHEEAFMLIDDADYSKNITGICIGYSDAHIEKLLDDNRVQLIIGFHDKTNDGTKRYRGARYAKNYNGLNEAVNNETGETVHIGFNQYVQKAEKMFKYDIETGTAEKNMLYHNGKLYKVDNIPNLAADLYLEMCKEKNYAPAYKDFAGHENYYKLLADFGLKDSKGHYAPHKKVAYNMPERVPYLDANGQKRYVATEEYIKQELEKELAVRDSIAQALSDTSANGIIPQFKQRVQELQADVSEQETGKDVKKKRSLDDEYFDKLLEELSWEDILGEGDLELYGDKSMSVEDTSAELKANPKKAEIYIRRTGLGKTHIKDGKVAVMKQSRIDDAIEDSGAQFHKTYARSYITRISPKDFIDLTVNQDHLDRESFDKGVIGDHGGLMQDWDYEKALKDSRQSPYLHIDKTTGRIIGHNGRHRIRALEKAGIKAVEIEVQFFDEDGHLVKYDAETIPDMAISSQFNTGIETHLYDVIPLNETHRAEIESTYGENATNDADISYKAIDKSLGKRYNHKKRDAKTVTKDEFNHHYWASANNILSGNEFGILESAIGAIKTGNQYNQNADGLYLIPVGENGVMNKIVLTDGEYNKYSIDAVIKINYDNEIELSLERAIIYASERKGIFTKTNGVVEVYYAKDFQFSDFQRKLTQNTQNSYEQQDGAGNSAKSKESRRLKPIDKDYFATVNNGYMKIAERMVDEAAKKAGYTIKAYHGSRSIFNAFDKSKLGSNTKTETSKRWFFAADKKTANSYYPYGVMQELSKKYSWAKPEEVKEKGKLYSLYIKMENPLTVDVKDYDYAAHRDKADAWMEFVEQAEKDGNDGIILLNAMDNQLDTSARESTVYMFKEPSQAKSADTVTYDENGNIIPLSKRFDSDKPEISYQETPIKGADKVMTTLPNDKVSLKDVITGKVSKEQLMSQFTGNATETTEALKVLTTNAQAALERVLKEIGVEDATARTNYIRAGKYAAQNAIEVEGAQYNLYGDKRVGESLGKILKPIYEADAKDGKTFADFELYLLHWHNTDRYEAGKPVFNKWDDPIEQHITSEYSRQAVAELDKKYPQFRKIAEKVWKFNDNNLQLAVDSGMYSQEYADNLREMYPHYVPTPREEYTTKAAALMGKNNLAVNNAKKGAKGSSARVLPIDDTMAAQTIQKTTSARINSLLVAMLENGKSDEFQVIESEDADIDIDTETEVTFYKDEAKNTHQVTFYYNGKKVTAQVSRLVFKGIEAFRPSSGMSDNVAIAAVAKVNSTFKKLVTSLNPFFSFFKNPVRDMQDALLYTHYSPLKFIKNYGRARKEIKTNGKYWQEAKAAGISAASVYDYEKGIEYKQNDSISKAKRLKQKLESASNSIEMSPRLAEYISAREAGLSVQEALLQAQDVTTNFGRGGTFAKTLNSTVMPFLNPSIQGFSKMVRSYMGENGKKEWVALIIKSLILGIGATALNDLMNDDDEEYEGLSDYVKEQNYLLGLGGGDFLKLPKGRVASVFGSLWLRGKRYAEGDEDAWKDYFKSVASAVTPVDNFTRTIFSPITDIQTNTAWHGGKIEGQKWDDTEPKNRYDESTSKISIWLGQVFNYSPIKIDYLLEQYGGIVADLVIPATSTQAETGIISQNMLTNATLNSKWSSKFYSTLEKYTYKKTAGDLQAKAVVRYLTNINSTVSDMQKKKQEIQASTTLSNADKLKETRIIQAAINTLLQETLGNVEYIYKELGRYDLSDESVYDKAYYDTMNVVIGAGYALESYNKEVYAKASSLTGLGIGYDTYYDYYFGLKNVSSSSGSLTKKDVIEYTMAQDIPTLQKIILIMSKGYKIKDGDIKGISERQAKTAVAKYIISLNISKAEKTELAEMLGLTVKNGKILLNE